MDINHAIRRNGVTDIFAHRTIFPPFKFPFKKWRVCNSQRLTLCKIKQFMKLHFINRFPYYVLIFLNTYCATSIILSIHAPPPLKFYLWLLIISFF